MNNTTTMDALSCAAGEQLDRWDLDELRLTIAEMSRRSNALADPRIQMEVELLAADLAVRGDDAESALRHLTIARMLGDAVSDDALKAQRMIISASVHLLLDEPADAITELERAWSIVMRIGSARQQVDCAIQLNVAFRRVHQWNAADPWIDTALRIAREAGLTVLELRVSLLAARALIERGDYQRRFGAQEQAVADWQSALDHYEDVWVWLQSIDTPERFRFMTLVDRSAALARLGRTDAAIEGLRQCLALLDVQPDNDTRIEVLHQLAVAHRERGDLEAAMDACYRGIELVESTGVRRNLESLVDLAAELAEANHDLEAAVSLLRSLLRLREEQSVEVAQSRARVAAVRLETERALMEATLERERSESLLRDNRLLRTRATELERDAMRDPLTGVANRRLFEARLADAFAEARSNSWALCVALFDVDHFKQVNDQHGHLRGDEVLKVVARAVLSQCRSNDLVARLGGDEFAILFSGIGPAQAHAVCERIRRDVEQTAWEKLSGNLPVTITVGVADIASFVDIGEGLGAIDAQLYEAKRSGRNRVASDVVPA